MMKKRHGIFKRATPEARTFRGVVYDSKLECSRAMQLAAEQTGLYWKEHPEFTLGCRENTYTADFRVRSPDFPYLLHEPIRPAERSIKPTDWIHIPDGYVEEIKGPVRTGIGRLKKLWRAYGLVPLVILTATGRATGLKQQWNRKVVIPDSMNPKRKGKNENCR